MNKTLLIGSALIATIIILLLTFVAFGASGDYYHSPTGYAVWWVEDDQTPPQALYEWSVADGGSCVLGEVVEQLARDFPSDRFTPLIPICDNTAIYGILHARALHGDGESASTIRRLSLPRPIDLGFVGGLYSHLDKGHRSEWSVSADDFFRWRQYLAPEGENI